MMNTKYFFALLLSAGLFLTACGGESTTNTDEKTGTVSDSTTATTPNAIEEEAPVILTETPGTEEAGAEVMAGKGPMGSAEYNNFLGFPMEGYAWKEKYRNQASSKGVYMVTGTYTGEGGLMIDIELEGCDSDHCLKPSMKKFEKYYRNLGTKAKFWQEDLGGRTVYFYSLDDAWDNKHALTIAGTSYQRESRYMVKGIEVITGDAELASRTDMVKAEIRKVFEKLPG